MQLKGNSLGKRQQELNVMVNEAASNNVDFDEVKAQDEADDLDKLFKIDLASKYKNVDYIIEVLKCGDSLYVTRALKCTWLYNDEYINFINPDYLHQHIFPFMSLKMKKKMLTNISIHVRNESRAAGFYFYCKPDLPHFAEKFLIFTSEPFKLNLIETNIRDLTSLRESDDYLKHFMGNSFELAEAYIKEVVETQSDKIFRRLRYMYSVSDIKYLDMIEKYLPFYHPTFYLERGYIVMRLGLRISTDIMKKHKQRVINNLLQYIDLLNENVFVKYITVDEAKQYAVQLLPDSCSSFWVNDFYGTYKFIIDLIPAEEKFEFIKTIFTDKYPGTPFEMTPEFNEYSYYTLMTVDEREAWALRHIESKIELLGVGEDFNWYRFVNFDKAFTDIKKYLLITTNFAKRDRILAVLAESAQNQRDLEKLFKYYYERHVNENLESKRSFLDVVMQDHNVYDFDENCWNAFNKLLYSMDVYNSRFSDYTIQRDYKPLALIYHVIHEKDFPEGLSLYMKDNVDFWNMQRKLETLSEERKVIMYNYLYKFFVEKISQYDNQPYDDDIQNKARSDISFVLELLKYFKKSDECPEIVKKYKSLDENYFDKPAEKVLREWDILRLLKQDMTLVCKHITSLENDIIKSRRRFYLNNLLKKLKTYFPNDVGQEYLSFFKKLLLNPSLGKIMASTTVHGIFQLADENYKCEVLTKYVPSNPKIDHCNIDRNHLYIQEGICCFACYSRPPVPLSKIRNYINGDYLKYCLPMFNSYLSTLPLPLCVEFVESLLDAPVSVQKHGLRLAFDCFNSENLKTLVTKTWKKTKNVSLRMVMYKFLLKYVIISNEKTQTELFGMLKSITLDLNHEDHEDVLRLILKPYKIPKKFRGEFLVAVWKTVSKFPENEVNVGILETVVINITRYYNLLEKEFLKKIINEHIDCMLSKRQIFSEDKNQIHSLQAAKWKLVATYFTKLNDDGENQKWILKSIKSLINKFIDLWREDTSVVPKSCFRFIKTLIDINFQVEKDKCIKNAPIFESILIKLEHSLPGHEIYLTVWNLQLTIIAIKALRERRRNDIASKYGREVCNLVRESVDSKTYNSAFIYNILKAIKNGLSNIEKITENYKFRHDLRALVGIEFVEFEMLETQLLAVEMLSSFGSSPSNKNNKRLLRKLKNVKSNDVQSLLYQKFVDSGFNCNMANILFE